MDTRYYDNLPRTVAELKSEARGLVARFSLVLDGENDRRTAWVALAKLYSHAESIFASGGFSLKGEAKTWQNMLRLANEIVIACGHAEPPPPS